MVSCRPPRREALLQGSLERWYGGKLRTLPHPDACRILEHMFGYPVHQLLAPADPPSQETSLILGQDDPRPATARTLAQGVIWAPGALIPGDLGMTENSAPSDPERAKQAGYGRAGLPHLIGPARERRAFPNRHSSYQRTALPARHAPRGSTGAPGGHTGMHARLSRERQAGTSRRIEHLRTRRGPDPGQQAATHTAPRPLSPSAICPWSPQHRGLQRPKVTHGGTERKRPA